jgi:hypothetical protein
MTDRLVSFPYLMPREGIVLHGEWLDDNDEAIFMDGMIRSWDPDYAIKAHRTLELRNGSLREQCKFGAGGVVRLGVSWYSPGTSLRSDGQVGITSQLVYLDSPPVPVVLDLSIGGDQLAGEVRIATEVTLVSQGTGAELVSPSIPGSILWRDEIRVVVEGAAARFPIQITEFPRDGIHAAWYLNIEEDLDRPVLGAVRLSLNRAHPAVKIMTGARARSAEADILLNMLYFDVGRQMLMVGLADEAFVDLSDKNQTASPYEDETLGRAIWNLTRTVAPRLSVSELRHIMINSAPDFEQLLQHGLRFLSDARSSS